MIDISIPMMRASGMAFAISKVSLPVPEPRSKIVNGLSPLWFAASSFRSSIIFLRMEGVDVTVGTPVLKA